MMMKKKHIVLKPLTLRKNLCILSYIRIMFLLRVNPSTVNIMTEAQNLMSTIIALKRFKEILLFRLGMENSC